MDERRIRGLLRTGLCLAGVFLCVVIALHGLASHAHDPDPGAFLKCPICLLGVAIALLSIPAFVAEFRSVRPEFPPAERVLPQSRWLRDPLRGPPLLPWMQTR